MGCGMTKLNREEATPGPMYFYYNPMHRNMEDLAPLHGSNNKDHDTATKRLLQDGGGHDDKVSLPPTSNVVGSEYMVVKQAPMQQKIIHMKAVDDESNIGGGDHPHNDKKLVDEEKKEKVMMKDDEKDKVIIKESKEGDDDDDDIIDGDEIHDSSEKEDVDDSDGVHHNNNNEVCVREASIFYPGSPSFRLYCVVSADSEDSCKDGEVKMAKREKALQNKDDDSIATEPVKVADKADDSTATEPMKLQRDPTAKKSRARRRLRGVLTSRGGMKNLLHAAACNPQRSLSGNKVT